MIIVDHVVLLLKEGWHSIALSGSSGPAGRLKRYMCSIIYYICKNQLYQCFHSPWLNEDILSTYLRQPDFCQRTQCTSYTNGEHSFKLGINIIFRWLRNGAGCPIWIRVGLVICRQQACSLSSTFGSNLALPSLRVRTVARRLLGLREIHAKLWLY